MGPSPRSAAKAVGTGRLVPALRGHSCAGGVPSRHLGPCTGEEQGVKKRTEPPIDLPSFPLSHFPEMSPKSTTASSLVGQTPSTQGPPTSLWGALLTPRSPALPGPPAPRSSKQNTGLCRAGSARRALHPQLPDFTGFVFQRQREGAKGKQCTNPCSVQALLPWQPREISHQPVTPCTLCHGGALCEWISRH